MWKGHFRVWKDFSAFREISLVSGRKSKGNAPRRQEHKRDIHLVFSAERWTNACNRTNANTYIYTHTHTQKRTGSIKFWYYSAKHAYVFFPVKTIFPREYIAVMLCKNFHRIKLCLWIKKYNILVIYLSFLHEATQFFSFSQPHLAKIYPARTENTYKILRHSANDDRIRYSFNTYYIF